MVQSKSDRERQKIITDKCQSLIELLLKDEDNKYCVDCDAKGPRWASWNLGIFLCIRCAGIHRSLGVHISKVKSVNLDAWTPDHVAFMQRMGNSRSRAIYEANLPDDFRRPQTDASLDSFIRAKYELKKYIAKDYVDPGPPAPAFNADEEIKRMKEQKKSRHSSSTSTSVLGRIPVPEPATKNVNSKPIIAPPNSNQSPSAILNQISMDTAKATMSPPPSAGLIDLLMGDPIDSHPVAPQPSLVSAPSSRDFSQDLFSELSGFGNVSSSRQNFDPLVSSLSSMTTTVPKPTTLMPTTNNNLSIGKTEKKSSALDDLFADLDILNPKGSSILK